MVVFDWTAVGARRKASSLAKMSEISYIHPRRRIYDSELPDIRQYVFHRNYHLGHINNALNFSDIDGDGLRAENDCDSDNDGDFDGGASILARRWRRRMSHAVPTIMGGHTR